MAWHTIVGWDYAAVHEDEVNVEAGEWVEILQLTSQNWCKVRRMTGDRAVGLVPRNYLSLEEPMPEGWVGEPLEEEYPTDDVYTEEPEPFPPTEPAMVSSSSSSSSGRFWPFKSKKSPKGEDSADSSREKEPKKKSSLDDGGELKKKKKGSDASEETARPRRKSSEDDKPKRKQSKEERSLKERSYSVENIEYGSAGEQSTEDTADTMEMRGTLKRRSASFNDIPTITQEEWTSDQPSTAAVAVATPSASSSSLASIFKIGRKKQDDVVVPDAPEAGVSASSSASSISMQSTSPEPDELPSKGRFRTWTGKKAAPKGKIPNFDSKSRPTTVMVNPALLPTSPTTQPASGAATPASADAATPGVSPGAASVVTMPGPTPTKKVHWTEKIDSAEREELLASMTKEQRNFQAAAHELRDTEADYLDDLNTIITLFRNRMREQQVLKPEHIETLFGNIDDIQSVTEWFLYELDTLAASSSRPPLFESVAHAFLESAPYFAHYTTYCINQPHAMELYRRKMAKDAFSNFLKEVRAMPESKGLTLESFLIKPIQRICKYPLLIRELLRHIDDGHPDKPKLEEAMAAVEAVVTDVNEGKRRAENLEKLNEIAGRIKVDDIKRPQSDEPFQIVNSTRQYLYDAPAVLIQDGKSAGERQLFLFDDLLLICARSVSVVGPEKYRAVPPYILETATLAVNDYLNETAEDDPRRTHVSLFRTGQRYKTVFYTFDLGVHFTKWLSEFTKAHVSRNVDHMAAPAVSAKERSLLLSIRAAVATTSSTTAEEEFEQYKREAEMKAQAAVQEAERHRQVVAAAAAAAAASSPASEMEQREAAKAAKKSAMDNARRDIMAQSTKAKSKPPVPARTYQMVPTQPASAPGVPVSQPNQPTATLSRVSKPLPTPPIASPSSTSASVTSEPVLSPRMSRTGTARVPSSGLAATAAAVAAGMRPPSSAVSRPVSAAGPPAAPKSPAPLRSGPPPPVPKSLPYPGDGTLSSSGSSSSLPLGSPGSSPGNPPSRPSIGPKPSASAVLAAQQRRATIVAVSPSASSPSPAAPVSLSPVPLSSSPSLSPSPEGRMRSRGSFDGAHSGDESGAEMPRRRTMTGGGSSSESAGTRLVGARRAPWEK